MTFTAVAMVGLVLGVALPYRVARPSSPCWRPGGPSDGCWTGG